MGAMVSEVVVTAPPAGVVSAPPKKALSAAGAVAQSIGAKMAIIVINAATGIVTARALKPTGRGELAAMILWPVFLASALTLGVPSSLTFQMKRNPERRSELMGAALMIAFLTSVLAMVLGGVFMHAWIAQYSLKTVFYAQLFLLSAPLTSLLLVGRAGLESQGNFTASNKLLIVSPLLTLLWLLTLLATHTMTPYSAALAYIPVGIVPIVWMATHLWKIFRPSLKAFLPSAKLLFSYGIRSYGIDLCGTMALYVDQALVVRVLLPGMMGIYVVALSLSRMLNVFHTSVIMVLFPKAVSKSPAEVRDMTSRAVRMSTLLTVAAGMGIIVLGPQVLALLFGADYSGAVPVLRILVVEVILSGATLVLSQAFMALGRPGIVTALQVVGLALTIPLMFVLAPRYGIVGAGLALLLSTCARLIFVLASFPIFLKMKVPGIFPKAEDFRFLMDKVASQLKLGRHGRDLAAAEGTK